MFSSSARRVACTASSTSSLTSSISHIAASPAIVGASQARSFQTHQRRRSASKPSNPADGSSGIAQGEGVAAAPAHTRSNGDKKSTARGGRRRAAKDVAGDYASKSRDASIANIPSVPNTQHLSPKEIAASSFFSLYRPISVTSNFPKTVSSDAFASIFAPRASKSTVSDVISTLSGTVNKLEAASQQQNLQWQDEQGQELRDAIVAETKHLDSLPSDSSLSFPQHIMSGSYQPFNPPPPPQPQDTVESLQAGAEAAEVEMMTQHRTYTAVLTVEESTDSNGRVTYMAHSSPLIEDEVEDVAPPTRFLERMSIRQERFEEYREQRAEETGMWAISVKRQRKLKMKKHKYKKLMKKTRNLRRRQDRI